jgi:hypothetical protein
MSKRRSLLALVTAVLAMLAIGVAATPAHAAGFSPIKIWHSTHCLDNATQNSAKLQMWSCSGASEQNWSASLNTATGRFMVSNQRTALCISAQSFRGFPVIAQPCDPSAANQQWKLRATGSSPTTNADDHYFVWESVATGLCLTTPSVANGTLVQTTECDLSDPYDYWNKAFL